ncbi:MAG: riboflavin synthase [Planctomycetota bacterium]|nr:riboflavin synthase [Planctomycetota bacterium]
MFTGIIEGLGEIRSITPTGQSYKILIDIGRLVSDVVIGDSIAVNGTCLTVTEIHKTMVAFDVITETVALTSFSMVKVGDRVNIEKSMPANGRFHGHVVAGHVDGTARLIKRVKSPGQTSLTFELSKELTEQMIHKGSITIDGISLTLTEVTKKTFSVALIPHTLLITNLGVRKEGDLVNIEVDQMGKWVRKILSAFIPEVPAPTEPTRGIVTPKGMSNEDLGRYLS